MTALVYALYVVAGIVLLAWAVALWQRTRRLGLTLTVVVLVGVCYDALLISTGGLIGEGSLLLALSWPRYLLHAVLTPLLLIAAVDLAGRTGLAWARRPGIWLTALAVVVGLMILGIATNVVGLELEPRRFQGTLRYAEAVTVPPIATIAVILLFAVVSGLFWRGTGWPWLFAATMLTLASGGVPVTVAGPALTSGAELVLLGSLLTAEQQLSADPSALVTQQRDSLRAD